MPGIEWFHENGCELQHPDPRMLFAVFSMTNGHPCIGCNCKETCPAWPKLQQDRILKIGILILDRMQKEILAERAHLPVCSSLPIKQVSKDGLVCPHCKSPINKTNAIRRYEKRKFKNTEPDAGLCACGHTIYFNQGVK